MKKYKVVKDSDVLTRGDIFTLTNDNHYTCYNNSSSNGYTYNTSITVGQLYMAKAISDGVVIELDPTDTTNYKQLYLKYKAAWDNTNDAIIKLRSKYQQDIDDVLNDFGDGKIAECQKVEATTVLVNLLKQLDDLQNKLKK